MKQSDVSLAAGRRPALTGLRTPSRHSARLAAAALLALACSMSAAQLESQDPWPAITRECRPWAYWWWMGSAVDQTNLTRELQRYQQAGLGGVHIIPIYGAKGWEDRFIDFLSPKWMECSTTPSPKPDRLGLGVDMTTGTGWCFGGPQVDRPEANATGGGQDH